MKREFSKKMKAPVWAFTDARAAATDTNIIMFFVIPVLQHVGSFEV
jgi:hypothetical protein